MDKIKHFFKKNWLNAIIIFTYMITAVYMAQFHELWTDEAQSWLIARDSSIGRIFSYIRYEGTPPLWVLIIKVFISCGLTVDKFYLLPIIFMSLGLIFLYTKFDIPWYIKILFPFTYFAFYQSAIVIRSYSLVLLGISMLFYYFPKRYENTYKYLLSLLFFMGISIHTCFLTAGFFAVTLVFLKQDYSNLDNKTKSRMKILFGILIIAFVLMFILLCPTKYTGNFGSGGNSYLPYTIGEATIANNNAIVQAIATIYIVSLIIYILVKKYKELDNKQDISKEILKFLTVAPLLIIFLAVRAHVRYFAIPFYIIFLYFLNNKKYLIIRLSIVFILIVQIVWNIQSCYIDYYEKYAAGKDVAQFLVDINYEEKIVDAVDYSVVNINPYFDKNIFYHTNQAEFAYYSWSLKDFHPDPEEVLANKADIYVIPVIIHGIDGNKAIIENSNNVRIILTNLDYNEYKVYSIDGNVVIKGHVDAVNTYLICVNKKVQEEMKQKNLNLKEEDRVFYINNIRREPQKIIDYSQVNK